MAAATAAAAAAANQAEGSSSSTSQLIKTEEHKLPKKDKSVGLTQSLESAQLGPYLDRLWDYKCPLTKGRNVSCMVWNKQNPVSIIPAVCYAGVRFPAVCYVSVPFSCCMVCKYTFFHLYGMRV